VPLNILARYRRNLKTNWARSRPGLGGVVRRGEGPECLAVHVDNGSRGSKVWLRLYPGGAQTFLIVGVVRLGGSPPSRGEVCWAFGIQWEEGSNGGQLSLRGKRMCIAGIRPFPTKTLHHFLRPRMATK